MAQVILLLVMKLLWCTPGFPFDPTGGGNRSLRTMCEMLASQGHEVRCVGTLRTGGRIPTDGRGFSGFLKENHALDYYERPGSSASLGFRGVGYEITAGTDGDDNGLNKLFSAELAWKPDILLTTGGNPREFARMERAKETGAKIVFGLRNGLYRDKHYFRLCDGIVTPSQWMTEWYKRTLDLDSTPLPLPINVEDCVSEPHTPSYVTMVNPSHEKGEQLVRAIAAALPGISFQIIESRAKMAEGWPPNCHRRGPFPHPRSIYLNTKILLVPSLWEEPGGRVVCEAMLNGIPPIVSDHGALPEVVDNGGIVIPTPRKLYDHSPITTDEIEPWVTAIRELIFPRKGHTSAYPFYQTRAELAGEQYDSRVLTPRYCAYFERILAAEPSARTTSPLVEPNKKEST
jgi:glycosyltransferase involved in cell wall biosynthesis